MQRYDGFMMTGFRRAARFALPALFCVAAFGAGNDQLAQIHSVYLLPMSSGFDQYLANKLTTSGVFQVVTDPQKADAIFTDRIGEALETQLTELYPPPEVAKKKEEGKDKDKADNNFYDSDKDKPVHMTAYSKGRGMLFLVDRRSRNVVWSTYARPKSFIPDDLNKTAQEITVRLQHALEPPKAKQ
ncbi:MAG: hypothetical protein ABI165_04140 [Bryobacteraceae bacterium]